MATIKEMAIEAYPIIENGAFKQSQMEYEVEIKQKRGAYFNGANAVLEIVENYIKNLDLGNSAEEKFYKLDVIADIGLFIEELKGE